MNTDCKDHIKLVKWKDQHERMKKIVEKLDVEREERIESEKRASENTKMKAKLLKESLRKKYDEERFVKESEEYKKRREKDPKYISSYEKLINSRMSVDDFEVKKKLGEGGFASVFLVEYKQTGELCALKRVEKSKILAGNHALRIRLERDSMVNLKSPWVVELKYTFQDDLYLYFVMEFCQGGDLRGLLTERLMNNHFFKEEEVAFYLAELILCLETVQNEGLCHRDLKPENILVGADGHLKITDFGLCRPFEDRSLFPGLLEEKEIYEVEHDYEHNIVSMKERRDLYRRKIKLPQLMYTLAGSPLYIAPEVLLQKGYRNECDFWSLGVIAYEFFFLDSPFIAETRTEVTRRIINYKTSIYYPPDDEVELEGYNRDVKDMLKMLICSSRRRVGKKENSLYTIDDLKNHPLFTRNGIDWKNLRQMEAPMKRPVRGVTDTKYFDQFSKKENKISSSGNNKKMLAKKKCNTDDILFQDFTYRKEE